MSERRAVKEASWSIPGSDGEPILGDAHLPDTEPRGVIVIAHGFKGYKDYGMFPRLAAECANAGFIVHRFNFSYSGMTNDIDSFARPDLFERDTWNKQVFDLRAVIEAIEGGELPGGGLPYLLFGHSRGGVTAMLTAGRFADDATFPQPAGVITAAAPARACSLSEDEQDRLLRDGFLESPSSRTGQVLRLGAVFLREQLDDPAGHDVLAMVKRICCPMLIVHGADDSTVPVEDARRIADAAGEQARVEIIPEGDHVFNVPNPLPDEAPPSQQLARLIKVMIAFTSERP